jgi:heterogeneous nuclear ribonucleoprotein A1/A3
VFDHVREAANKDESNRKLFLHGLTWDSTSDGVKRALAGYGEVESCHVIMEKSTGKSKGFGFVTFKDMDAANAVLEVARREALSIDVRMRVPPALRCVRARCFPLTNGVASDAAGAPACA